MNVESQGEERKDRYQQTVEKCAVKDRGGIMA